MVDPRNPARAVADANERVFNIGAASVLEPENKGTFTVKKYPEDLGSIEYPHYVMFFIHVRKSDISSMEQKPEIANVQFDASQNNVLPKTAGFAGAAKTLQFGVGGAAAGAAVGEYAFNLGVAGKTSSSLAGKLSGGTAELRTVKTLSRGIGAVGGFGIGAGLGAAVAAQDDRTQVLLKDAIALYVNGTPSTSYAADWSVEDLGILGGVSQQLVSSISSTSSGIDALKNALTGAGGVAQSFIMKKARETNPLGAGNVGAFAESTTGQVANPFKAQLFKNMEFRSFGFEYTFAPRSKTEYDAVQDIIKTFKLYMHPTLGKEKFIMDYPAEFTLGFYHRDQLNKHLFKVSNCALTSMKVDYGGTDLTTFRDNPGAPSEINLKLTFVELELLSRERVEMGY
jgi:hypothetical protein